jgi:hypothetical protein
MNEEITASAGFIDQNQCLKSLGYQVVIHEENSQGRHSLTKTLERIFVIFSFSD